MQKKILLSVVSGILLGISFPTYGFPLFIFFAFVPLLLIEQETLIYKEKRSYLTVFLCTYIAFLLWNTMTIHWLYFAKRPDGSYSLEAVIFPILFNSFFMSGVMLLYHFVKKNAGSYFGLFFFPCIWMTFERLHLDWELTFPWLNLGNAFADYPSWIQWYEYTGTFGGTLWILLLNIFIFYNYRAYQASRKKIYTKKLALYIPLFIGIPILFSLIRYYTYQEKGEKMEVVVVQPEVDPYTEKYSRDSIQLVGSILDLARPQITSQTKFVVAPETAFPGRGYINYDFREESHLVHTVRDWIRNSKNPQLAFVSGTSLAKYYPSAFPKSPSVFFNPYTQRYEEHFNSAIEITASDTVEVYQKSKLVVGVENLPYMSVFKNHFTYLSEIFGGTMHSLGTQREREVFTNGSIKIAPIVCYESIYGEYVTDYVKKGAEALFIMTNDSWWEESQGHKQLLVFGRLRAIENRRSIARSANSGISCFINQRGDIQSGRLNYLEQGAIKGEIALNEEETLYTKYGDYLVRIALLFTGIIFAFACSQMILNRKKR